MTIRIKTKCLNPTAAKKKTVKISRKDTEDMLSKLDVSFSSLVCSAFMYCSFSLDVIYHVPIYEGVILVQYI